MTMINRLALFFALALVLLVGVHSSAPVSAQPVDLTPALLTVEDFPRGWSSGLGALGSIDAPGSQGAEPPCGAAPDEGPEPIARAEAGFQRGQLGPFVVQTVTLSEPEDAAQTMAALRSVSLPCDWEVPVDGSTMLLHLAQGPDLALGEETVSWELDGTLDFGAFQAVLHGQVVYIRRGGAISTVMHFTAALGAAAVDTALTERLARRADERLAALVP